MHEWWCLCAVLDKYCAQLNGSDWERSGSTALGDLSCEMKAVTSDLLLTNEKEGAVIYGINEQIILRFWAEMLLHIPPCSSPNTQHQPARPLLHKPTWTPCNKHTYTHTCYRNEHYNPPSNHSTHHVLSFSVISRHFSEKLCDYSFVTWPDVAP